MTKKNSTINFSHNLRYNEKYNEYTVQMIHRRFPWWILLLLLPLLLLIECKHDITAHVYEVDTEYPVVGANVNMYYSARYLFKSGEFFHRDLINMDATTDETGSALFKDCPCSVFSYIFFALTRAEFTCISDCHDVGSASCNFHYTRNVDIPVDVRRENLRIRVVDKESGDVLPGATVTYIYQEQGKERRDSVQTDGGGIAVLNGMRYCGEIEKITASLYGYADTLRMKLPCADLIIENDSTDLRLRRIKDRIEFFVRDVDTKEPIPEAVCQVTLTYKSSKEESRVLTSLDGKGRGVYDDAFLLYTVGIKASKEHYNDSVLEGGPYIVDKFNLREPDKRTIWLRPMPQKKEFINVDSITGKPIANVRNRVIITDSEGHQRESVVKSNSNGVFPVVAKASEKVVIISECEPSYWPKRTEVGEFGKVTNRKIPLKGRPMKVNFCTVKNKVGGNLLPDCQLRIHGSVSGSLQPSNSGDGEFTVMAFIFENLSIDASKDGYESNSSTVHNTPVGTLVNKRTDIPLKEKPLIYEYDNSIQGSTKDCYDLKERGSRIELTWNICPNCTMLIVSDGNGKVIKRLGRDDPQGHGGGIQYSAAFGTIILTIPTQNVCISQVDVYGHRTYYRIRKLTE